MIAKYEGVLGVAITHRLGEVGVGEESVHVCVASVHRGDGWRAGEEVLELVKEKAEVWKREVFVEGEGVWRENKAVDAGEKVAGGAVEEVQGAENVEGR